MKSNRLKLRKSLVCYFSNGELFPCYLENLVNHSVCLGQKCQNIAPSYECKQNLESWNICGHLRSQNSIDRGGSRTAATSKMERFVLIVNSCQPLTIITKCCILDVAAVSDPPLIDVPSWLVRSTFLINRFVRNRSIVFCCALRQLFKSQPPPLPPAPLPPHSHVYPFLTIFSNKKAS